MAEVTERRTALCRGCEEQLTEDFLEGQLLWFGADGLPVCIPAQFGRSPVLHMPLPEGFRGAPA